MDAKSQSTIYYKKKNVVTLAHINEIRKKVDPNYRTCIGIYYTYDVGEILIYIIVEYGMINTSRYYTYVAEISRTIQFKAT